MGVGGPEEKEACPHDLGWSRMEGTRGVLARGEKWMTNQSELGGRMNAFQNLKKKMQWKLFPGPLRLSHTGLK